MEKLALFALPLILGYLLDVWLGDPESWPHPIRFFGLLVAVAEKQLNRDGHRFVKGMVLTLILCAAVFLFFLTLNTRLQSIHPVLLVFSSSIWVWYGLANKTLIKEGQAVFRVLQQDGIEAGRKQLSRIVGRDTSRLSAQQIRIAVLETMSENLSDGVIAPLFFYALAGIPGLMTYKMINTLDSMIGYRSERYEQFGKFAARLDDVANYIPARLTALLMVLASGNVRGGMFALQFGNQHKSPNAGYPEAALAGILNCRFGGPNVYHGVLVDKPFIGKQDRLINVHEINRVSRINHLTCLLMIVGILGVYYVLINA